MLQVMLKCVEEESRNGMIDVFVRGSNAEMTVWKLLCTVLLCMLDQHTPAFCQGCLRVDQRNISFTLVP